VLAPNFRTPRPQNLYCPTLRAGFDRRKGIRHQRHGAPECCLLLPATQCICTILLRKLNYYLFWKSTNGLCLRPGVCPGLMRKLEGARNIVFVSISLDVSRMAAAGV
jgi:hypothetical protein